jgi:hypothetical protein
VKTEWELFCGVISLRYGYDFNDLNELNAACSHGMQCVKLLTTFLGKFFPLYGRKVHTCYLSPARLNIPGDPFMQKSRLGDNYSIAR